MSNDLTTADAKRDELRAKIEAGERRLAERTLADDAKDAADAATEYVKQNPLTVLAGAVAIGLAVGAVSAPGRRIATSAASTAANTLGDAASGAAKGVGGVVKKRGSIFTSMIADAVVAYGIKLIDEALEKSRSGQDALEDLSDNAAAKARELRRDAEYVAGSAVDKGRTVSRRTRRRAERAVRDLTDRISS